MLLLPPKPIHPPGTALVQCCSHKPPWKTRQRPEPGWGYQSTVPGKSSSLGAQVTSVHSVQASGCPATMGTVSAHQAWKRLAVLAPHLLFLGVAEAKANKVVKPLHAPFIPANKYEEGEKAPESHRASDLL